MYTFKHKRVPAFFVLILYFLFAVFLMGCAFGVFYVGRSGHGYTLAVFEQNSVFKVIFNGLIYHLAVIFAGRLSVGALAIPLILVVRGCVLSVGFSAVCMTGGGLAQELSVGYGLSAALQLPSLFYIAAVSLWRWSCKYAGVQKTQDNALCELMRRDALLLGLLLVGGMAANLIVL